MWKPQEVKGRDGNHKFPQVGISNKNNKTRWITIIIINLFLVTSNYYSNKIAKQPV